MPLPSSSTSSSLPSATTGSPKNELVTRGLFKRWEVQNYQNENDITVPPSTLTDLSPDALRRQDIYILQCKNTVIQISQKMKGIKLEKCEQVALRILQGTVGTIELVNCKKVSLYIAEPVAGLRVDESRDIVIDVSWTCRVGYIDDSADDIVVTTPKESTPNSNSTNPPGETSNNASSSSTDPSNDVSSESSSSSPSVANNNSSNNNDDNTSLLLTSPSSSSSSSSSNNTIITRKPGTGLVLISSGSHGIRLLYPLNNTPNSPTCEKLIPDTLYTVLNEEKDEPETTIVDPTNTRWGRNVVARVPSHHSSSTTVPMQTVSTKPTQSTTSPQL